MNSEEKISVLIQNLEFKTIEAKTVQDIFPDTIVRVVDRVGIRYQSPTLNGCADKTEFAWDYGHFFVRPYTELTFEYNGLARIVRVHTEPYEVQIANKIINQVILEDYTGMLTTLNFSKNIIRLVDIEIANGIIHHKWKVDKSTLTAKVKTFLVLS